MAHKGAAMGGRSLRPECLCLDSVFAGGPTAPALWSVFRLLINGYTRDHWTHAERNWARERVGEPKPWWNAGQMDVPTTMSVKAKVANKRVKKYRQAHKHKVTTARGQRAWITQNNTTLQRRSAVLQKDVWWQTALWCFIWPKSSTLQTMEKKCDSRVVYNFFWIAKIDYLAGNWNFESILKFLFVVVPLLIWKVSQVAGFITLRSLGLLLHKTIKLMWPSSSSPVQRETSRYRRENSAHPTTLESILAVTVWGKTH